MKNTLQILGFTLVALWRWLPADDGTVRAQDVMQAPAYSRTRMGAGDWGQRGGGYGYGGGNGRGYGGYYDPYYYGGPVVQGSWYQRPYPYHFDYYRHRWGGDQAAAVHDVPPPADCPCATGPAMEPTQAPEPYTEPSSPAVAQ